MMKKKRIRYLCMCRLLLTVLLLTGCNVEDRAISLPVSAGAEKDVNYPALEEEKEQTDAHDILGQMIYVHVCGAVVSPGVVCLPAGSRREAAVSAAGGFAENACETYVNLAALLTDGEQLYIPDEEEGVELRQAQYGGNVLVNINTANEEQLCTLPGIGSTRAKDIIAYRERHGSFARTEDIMQVNGIKESTYQRICDLIVVE